MALVERRIQRPVQAGRDHEQRLIEERHHAAHLVQRGDRLDAQRRGVPQQGDLLAEAAADLGILAGRQPRVIELVEEAVAAAQRHEHRAPSGLGRMSRQDEAHRQPVDDGLPAATRHAGAAQPVDGIRDRAIDDGMG
jgi:hypothetical protein